VLIEHEDFAALIPKPLPSTFQHHNLFPNVHLNVTLPSASWTSTCLSFERIPHKYSVYISFLPHSSCMPTVGSCDLHNPRNSSLCYISFLNRQLTSPLSVSSIFLSTLFMLSESLVATTWRVLRLRISYMFKKFYRGPRKELKCNLLSVFRLTFTLLKPS
jgi:hypothetical protein